MGAYGYLKNMVTQAGGGLVVKGSAIVQRMGLNSWQRVREVIWTKALAVLQVPIYHTIHGKGVGEPGVDRWLDSKTFVFNESIVANEKGLVQIQFILDGLGIEFVITQSGMGGHNFQGQRRHKPRRHVHDGSRRGYLRIVS